MTLHLQAVFMLPQKLLPIGIHLMPPYLGVEEVLELVLLLTKSVDTSPFNALKCWVLRYIFSATFVFLKVYKALHLSMWPNTW